jgi:hypothetical protein
MNHRHFRYIMKLKWGKGRRGKKTLHRSNELSSSLKFKVKCLRTILTHNNSSVIETGFIWGSLQKVSYVTFTRSFWSYGVPGPFQRQLKNNYLIFKLNYFIIISFFINFHNNYQSPFLILTPIITSMRYNYLIPFSYLPTWIFFKKFKMCLSMPWNINLI